MHFFSSSMVKSSMLIGNACWNTVLLSLDVITGGCTNKFWKWSFHFSMQSSWFFALILPLFVPFLLVNSCTVSRTSLLFWCSAAVLLLSTFPWAYLFLFFDVGFFLVLSWHHPISLQSFWLSPSFKHSSPFSSNIVVYPWNMLRSLVLHWYMILFRFIMSRNYIVVDCIWAVLIFF